MNNWPLFEKRYAPETLPTAPGYQDILVALLFGMLLVAAIIWSFRKRQGSKQSSLVTAVFSVYAIIQTIVISGLIYAQLSADLTNYWRVAGWGMLYALGYFTANIASYSILWYSFGTPGHILEWYEKFLMAWGVTGLSLMIPLVISLTSSGTDTLTIFALTVIYILFRMSVVVVSLGTFPKLLRYPLHIILYLCVCELAPMLFVLV